MTTPPPVRAQGSIIAGPPGKDPTDKRSTAARSWFSRFFNLRPARAPRTRLVRLQFGEGLFLGGSPALADIEDLARKGLRSLVNLNMEGEPGEGLSPNVEASWAHALGLRHERASLDADLPQIGDVNRFLRALASVPRPVFVHSRHGRRAAAMGLVHLGLQQGLSGAAAVQAAKGLGITCTLDPLRRFAQSAIDRDLESGRGGDQPERLTGRPAV